MAARRRWEWGKTETEVFIENYRYWPRSHQGMMDSGGRRSLNKINNPGILNRNPIVPLRPIYTIPATADLRNLIREYIRILIADPDGIYVFLVKFSEKNEFCLGLGSSIRGNAPKKEKKYAYIYPSTPEGLGLTLTRRNSP